MKKLVALLLALCLLPIAALAEAAGDPALSNRAST